MEYKSGRTSNWSCGTFFFQKNHVFLIDIFYAIQKKTNAKLILVGDGELRTPIQTKVSQLGLDDKVIFTGVRSDVADLLQAMDVFVFPSNYEGLLVASLEAMYCGLPLITSNIRGLSDIMEDGVTGYLCQPDDVNGFAERILELKSNYKLRESEANRNREVVVSYCIENIKREVMDILMQECN